MADAARSGRSSGTRTAARRESDSKRRRIVDAALRLFRRAGLRATSMEAIAAEAGMAKATLYGEFSDKAEVFTAVARAVARRGVDTVRVALAREDAVEDRVGAGLQARHASAFDLVRASPHAGELLSRRHPQAGDYFRRADETIAAALARTLERDPALARGSRESARALLFGSDGIAERANDEARALRAVEGFARTYLAGVRAAANAGNKRRS